MSTIAAIGTPIGQGGISIIRISGEESLKIIQKIFKRKNSARSIKSYSMYYGVIIDKEEVVDEVLVSYFKAPNSYTGEDVCEINCHGGILVTKRILSLVLQKGAQIAEPGEFTKRAFLNGKLDLSQAEAVIDVIQSKSLKESKIAIMQLEGRLGRKISNMKAKVMDLLVDLEANIDYPEYGIEEVERTKIASIITQTIEELKLLERSFEEGKKLKEGINTVIIGKPNVGKSSLMNALLKEDRVIVTDIAGTTRDTIEETLVLNDITLNIIDTAGIHQTNDKVEEIGIKKSKLAMEKADLILLILDFGTGITAEDEELLKKINTQKCLVLVNKIDLKETRLLNNYSQKATISSHKKSESVECIDEIKKKIIDNYGIDSKNIIEISTKTEFGIDEIGKRIEKMFQLSKIDVNEEEIITSLRQKEAIQETRIALEKVIIGNEQFVPVDMLSIAIQNAMQNLGKITGETVSEEVINGIFKKFCLGK